MEAPPVREGVFSPEAAYYIDKLARKEDECSEIVAQFNKYKVKTKVRFDQLRHEISNILHERNVEPEEERHHPAMLLIALNETQFKLDEAEKLSSSLRAEVDRQQLHINDQIILMKNLEGQLREWEESAAVRERRSRDEPVDMERVQQQMLYKDERIVELNSVILDKERQILDLQDACRSASEVATSKKEAMRIVQKKFDDMERRSRREASTETDDRLTGVSFEASAAAAAAAAGGTPAAAAGERQQRPLQQQLPSPQRTARTSSPGRAVHVVAKNGCSSPPPLDPAELDDQPGTSKLAKTNVDENSSLLREKKQRKRVTFDLPLAASREDISRLTAAADSEEITEALLRLTAENERLRAECERMEAEAEAMGIRVAKAESGVSEAEREARHASLKARAVAQARIKELEDRMASQNTSSAQQIERLSIEAETLRSTRDWEVEQNASMREQLAHTKEKLRQMREELDASEVANRAGEKKLDEKEELMVSLVAELEEAEGLAVFLEDQKHQILDDVDGLRDAMQLYEEYIELLEADIVIYETRVGHLREELGVSKMNQRDHIKSKAFNTKLQMISKEKEQIDRKANDERLRTKALHAKVQILEAENEKLMARLCEAEMVGEDSLSLDAACKQLQTRMEQAEQQSAQTRAEFESRLRASDFASESLREECDRLRAARDAAEQQAQHLQLQHSQLLQQQQPGSSKQTMLQQQQHQEDSSLDAALRLAQSAQETLTRERDELAERVHVLGGENFELTTRTEEAERHAKRIESDFARLEARLRASSEREAAASGADAERAERAVEREQELIELRARVAEREATVERMEAELKRIRAELDHTHLSMAETTAVKEEVQQLQHQLEIEREAAAGKWQQVMVQLKSYEELAASGGSGWDSRKTSIDESATAAALAELRAARAEAEAAATREQLRALQQAQQQQGQHQQHLVQHELPRRAASLEDAEEGGGADRHECDRLRARVEELEAEAELSHELSVESSRTVQTLQARLEKSEHERRLLESLTVEFSADIAEMREDATAAAAAAEEAEPAASSMSLQQVQQVQRSDNNGEAVEAEALRQRVEEMEEEAALSAELHVEMGRTVQALEARIKEMEMERRLHEMMSVDLTAELQELRETQHLQLQQPEAEDAAAVESAAAAAAAAEELLQEEKRERVREQQAARDELQRLQLALYAAEDARREVARRLAEKEQTESLVRATAATFDAVSATAAGAPPSAVGGEPATSAAGSSAAVAAAVVAAASDEQAEENATLVQENVLLREAVYQNVLHGESVTSDVARLLELKEELEKAVGALRGEIWSLNGQLKASVLDRENLQDRVVELDTRVAIEKRRADLLDVELAEQVELRENAQRQAAEAENESNRRLAECAEMDGKREDLEKAYALLAGYYSQLQEAYNVLYSQQQHVQQVQLQQSAASEEGAPREDRATQTDAAAAGSSEPSTSSASLAGPSTSSSSRRAQAEAYVSRLAALRELSVQLTKSVLATELATLESELDNSITSIEGLTGECPEAGTSVDALLDAIMQDYDGSAGGGGASSVSPDARAKIAAVHSMLRAKINEVERVHSALREQRGVCSALEERLTELEAAGPPPAHDTSLGSPRGVGGSSGAGGRAASSLGPSELEERIEECEALRAHVEQLQHIIQRYVAREEAARLATREADVDSLFRANADLAHENVRLQNELDEGGRREEEGEERELDAEESRQVEQPEFACAGTQTHDERAFDEAELELVKEELETERVTRRRMEQRAEETEREMRQQQEQLEETIVDLTVQLTNRAAAAPAAASSPGDGLVISAAEKEALESAAAAAAADAAALRSALERERAAREGAEAEMRRAIEEMEDMQTELQLKTADGEEMTLELKQQRAAAAAAAAKEVELQQQLEQLREAAGKTAVAEVDGWGNEGWGEEEEEQQVAPVLPAASRAAAAEEEELAELRAQLQQERAARAEAEAELAEMKRKRLRVEGIKAQDYRDMQIREEADLREAQQRLEKLQLQQAPAAAPAPAVDDDGWGWGEEEKEEEQEEEVRNEEKEPEEESSSENEVSELRAKLDWERAAREEAELQLAQAESEQLRLVQHLQQEALEKREAVRAAEQLRQAAREREERKREKQERRRRREDAEDEAWDAAEQSGAVEKLTEQLAQMCACYKAENAVRVAAEESEREMRAQLRRWKEAAGETVEDDGWGAEWGEEASSSGPKPMSDRQMVADLRALLADEQLQNGKLVKQLREAEKVERQLREEIEEMEEEQREREEEEAERRREERQRGDPEATECRHALAHSAEMQQLEKDFRDLKTIYNYRLEELETDCRNVRETLVRYEWIMNEKDQKIGWLEREVAGARAGREGQAPLKLRSYDGGCGGGSREAAGQRAEATTTVEREQTSGGEDEVHRAIVRANSDEQGAKRDEEAEEEEEKEEREEEEGEEEEDEESSDEVDDEEVDYRPNTYMPEDPEDVTDLYRRLNGFREEAQFMQLASRSGTAEAHHHERIRLRQIVKAFSESLQEFEDEFFNEGGYQDLILVEKRTKLKAALAEVRKLQKSLAEAQEQLAAAAADAASSQLQPVPEETERLAELQMEMERLQKQNDLLQNSEARLVDCLNTSDARVAEAEGRIESLRQELAAAVAAAEAAAAAAAPAAPADTAALQAQIDTLQATVDHKESQLTQAVREAAAALQAKEAVEKRLAKIMEAAKTRKAATAAAAAAAGASSSNGVSSAGAASAAASPRSYVGGSRRTSAASSVWNEEIHEEPEVPQAVRVDHGVLKQQIDFSSSASSTVGDTSAFRRRAK